MISGGVYFLLLGVLLDGEWKPKNKGFDFLRIMDWEQEQENKKSAKRRERYHSKGNTSFFSELLAHRNLLQDCTSDRWKHMS